MSLRWRKDGTLVCAAKSEALEDDTYIDDRLHYQLAVVSQAVVPSSDEESSGRWHWVSQKALSDSLAKFIGRPNTQEVRDEIVLELGDIGGPSISLSIPSSDPNEHLQTARENMRFVRITTPEDITQEDVLVARNIQSQLGCGLFLDYLVQDPDLLRMIWAYEDGSREHSLMKNGITIASIVNTLHRARPKIDSLFPDDCSLVEFLDDKLNITIVTSKKIEEAIRLLKELEDVMEPAGPVVFNLGFEEDLPIEKFIEEKFIPEI